MQEGVAKDPSLPTELWIRIIGELPFHYQRSCLFVSKFFHDISMRYVFASIHVRLGSIRDFYLADENGWCDWNASDKTEADSAVARSYELLQHIARSPSGLASVVKHVSVRAYAFVGYNPTEELLGVLEEVLSVVRLRRFAWYGCHPMPRPQVLEILSTASHDTMEEIVLPADLMDQTPVLAFGRLKSLSYLNRYGDSYRLPGKKDVRIAHMGHTITATPSSLRSLSILGEALRPCHVHRLSTLVDLTLTLITDVEPLGTVLTYCFQLRSLTVLVGSGRHELAAILREHSSALPRLTAFQLSCALPGKDLMMAVTAFLATKSFLERLELGHLWDTCPFNSVEPVLQILPALPRLRALGLELSDSCRTDRTWMSNRLLDLNHLVSRQLSLTALSLRVTALFASTPTVTKTEWIQFFRALRSCRFIHISTNSHYTDTGVLRRTLFDYPPRRVELVGFNEDLRWAERDSETGEQVGYSESWPLSRVYNRTVEDFGCEEWEWLMRQLDLRLLGRGS